MPDFDKNLKPILKNEDVNLPNLDNPASTGRFGYQQSVEGKQSAVDQFFGRGPVVNSMAPTVTAKELYENRRYEIFSPDITDIENQKANAQSWGTQAANGILKGLNLAATTTVGGFAMLEGALESAFSGRLADIWDNKILRDLDDWNNKVDQEYLPNYYSTKETEASWYSTDNWFRPNFLFDKLVKNSGYAVGAMISGNIANAGLLRAGRGLGALADAYAVGAEASQSFKTFTPLLKNMSRAFSVGKNVEAAAALEKGIASVADVTAQASELAEIAAQTNKFFKINDLGRRTAIAAYSSAGESSFEALQTSREYRKNAIAQFTQDHGYEPTGQDLEKINQDSESVGKVSFFANMGILSATEYVQLPRLLGSSYSASKQAANSLMGQVDNVLLREGKYVAEEAATKFGKIYDKAKGVTRYIFDPKEALQEGLQTGLQVGVQNYYNKAYQTGNANVWVDGFLYGVNGVNKEGKGVGVLNSKEGMESILLGGITGGMMQIKGNISQQAALATNTQAFINTLNSTPSFKQAFQDKMDGINRGVILQQQQQAAVVQGDRLEAKDIDADLLHNYLAPRIKYGRFDMITEDIKELKRDGLTEGGLSQLKEQGLANINDTVETYQQRLANFERVAAQVNELYKSLDLRYSGEVDEKGNRKYSSQVIDKLVYAGAKIMNYDTRIPQVNASLAEAGIDTTAILTDIITNKKPNKEATDAVIEQINNMNVTSEVKDDLKLALTDTIELSLRRKLFIDQYDDIKSNPEKYQVKTQLAEEEEGPVEVDQVEDGKTKKRELTVGQEYSLNQSYIRDGNGLVLAPKITVQAQTLGGEYEVKLPNGRTSFLTPEQFKAYNVSEVDNTSQELSDLLDNVITRIVSQPKYKDVADTMPAGEEAEKTLLQHINEQNNPELIDEIEAAFKTESEEFMKQAERIAKDNKLAKELNETLDLGGEVVGTEQASAPNATKPVDVLPRATVASQQIPGYRNSNFFGVKLNSFPNRKNIRGVYVTQANEAKLGLGGTMVDGKYVGGLMNYLKGDSDVDPAKTIAFVMVEQIGDKLTVIGKDGKPLAKPTFETAVFQVMPDPKFKVSEKYGGKSMFREGTPEDVKENIIARYTEFVNETLSETSLIPHTIEASFGKAEVVANSRTAVANADLIKSSDLNTKSVLYIPTTDGTITRGSTSYANPLGKIFLKAANGYVMLQNNKHSEKQAGVVYDAILELAKIANTEFNLQSDNAKRLVNWLRSTVYWGKPYNAPGVNSVWFEKGKLYMGNEGKTYTFTQVGIEAAKADIIANLQNMYHNVRSASVSSELKTNSVENWKLPYEQILGVKDGNIEAKQWKNYQSYLLSSEGRNSEDIPLTTNIKATTSEDEVNRQGVYFVATDMADRYAAPLPKVKAPKTLTPGSPKADVTNAIEDGKVTTISNPAFGTVHFIANFSNLDEIQFVTTDPTNPDSIKMAADNTAAFAKVEAGKIAASIAQKIRNEQAAVAEEAKVVAPIIEENNISETDEELMRKQMNETEDDAPFRTKLRNQVDSFEKENWPRIEKFLKEKFPNLPVYRVKNIIRNAAGQEMFGMFKDGAIYVYEGAETGTVYHEVFHGVYRMFTSPEERNSIRDEFRSRAGSFTDRATGQELKYSDATDIQIEEQLAEELIDYIQNGKLPAKPKDGRPFIVKMFADFVNFVKSLFTGEKATLTTNELFKQIKKGDFKQYSPITSSLSYANRGIIDIDSAVAGPGAVARLKMSGQTVHDIMQQMTYITLGDIVKSDEGLFNIEKRKKSDLYTKLKDNLQKTALKSRKEAENDVRDGNMTNEASLPIIEKSIALWKDITDNWDDIVAKHEEYLKAYSIQFDENEETEFATEDRSKGSDYIESSKIDNFKKAAAATKLLLSTVPIVRNGKLDYSSINGARLLPVSEVYMTLLNKTHNSRNVDEMISRIYDIAKNDENYRTLYERITNTKFNENNFDFSTIKNTNQEKLISALWKLLKKQNPEVKNLFVLENGEVQVGDSNFGTATRQLSAAYTSAVINSIKTTPKYFTFDKKENAFVPVRDDKGVAAIEDADINTPETQRRFLGSLGISFTKDEYDTLGLNNSDDQERFQEAVRGIKKSFVQAKKITTLSGKTLSIKGRLMTLAELKVKLENPEFDSTFYNVNGEMTQTFLGTNAASNLFDTLSQVANKKDLANTPYAYLLTDSFAQNSTILNMMFDPETGDRIEGSNELMKTSWADGTQNATNGKKTSSSKLKYKDRLIQEINMNLAGYYYTLVPGDASLEWQTYMKNAISADQLLSGNDAILDIFKGYFTSEMNLAREDRPTKNSKDLRFFKPILGESLHNKLIEVEGTPEAIYENNKKVIDDAVLAFINKKTNSFKANLEKYGIITPGMGRQSWEVTNLQFAQGGTISEQNLNRELTALSVNFMINNIELHKLLFSDPYQYSDELKRIKNFLSPRQSIISNSANMNDVLDEVWNKGYERGDIGYTDMTQDYFRTITASDVLSTNELADYSEEPYEESDGSGIVMFKAYRNFRIRANDWTDENEEQYRYDIAWEKRFKGLPMSEAEKTILKGLNPNVKSTYTSIKPIVSGNKGNGQSYNDIVLDKFALYPLSFRILQEINLGGNRDNSNAIEHYNKMQAENIDYSVFKSGRKVGAQTQHKLYNEDGSFNSEPYDATGIVNIPFGIISVQSEVPSKEIEQVTRGSQITKLATMDFMEAGVPIDFEKGGNINDRYKKWFKLTTDQKLAKSKLYKEIKNNQALLEAIMEEGYQNLLKQMGIIENADESFSIDNTAKVGEILRKEILKREVNENIADALAGFLEGHTVIEATPAYQQIRSILYSIADREVISPKISGGMKVQIPSTLLEDVRGKAVEINGKQAYASDVLGFYTDKDGKRVCEIMLGRWFYSPMSDKDLLDYLNNTKEGQEILSGIGFRIPTQKQNSIDSFVIKQFLPEEFGDNVVIPSALVKKAGSDFDIDKLSVYLKNVYEDADGNVRLVPYVGVEEGSKDKFNSQLNLGKDGYKMSLENAYIQSLQNLVSSPENFQALVKPNSADQLKGLAKEITKKLGMQSLDSSSLDNMLDREYMSRLRQAFVSGKYAIGIAARNQTNHSLNQRQLVYVDPARITKEDEPWLKDGAITFEDYNKINVGGKDYATISMVDNVDGQKISDINAQFIDGYVDISKGPWIMELGATPNVASTWMFLSSIGVPIDTIAYFMNQPIIRDYLAKVENSGYSWLFIDDYVAETKALNKYSVGKNYDFSKIKTIPSKAQLRNTVGAIGRDLNRDQKAEQQFMLDEFLKYAKMASQMFTFSQGTNFDTATFNDPYLVFKKMEQLKKAQGTIFSSLDEEGNPISGVDSVLKNSFLGKLAEKIGNIRNAYAEILKSDAPNVRNVIENVLVDYVDMPDSDFIRVSQKAVSDLFDWAVQIDKGYNKQITDLLLSKDNAAGELSKFITEVKNTPNHPLRNNQIIKLLDPIINGAVDGVNNAKISNKTNKVFDQNQIIYGFNEMKQYLESQGSPLYSKLVRLAVLQSGLSNSPISFTSLLPYEDFKEIYNKTLSNLENMPNLADFNNLNVFQRNNWNDSDVVPSRKAKKITTASGDVYYQNNTNFAGNKAVTEAVAAGEIPKLLKMSSLSREAQSDVVIYSWEEVPQGKKKYDMIKAGDFSYIKKGLFQKVYSGTAPLSFLNKFGTPTYVYKMINAWGDSRRVGESYFSANEFYAFAQKSVIDNGFLKADEVEDNAITQYFSAEPATIASTEPKIQDELLDEDAQIQSQEDSDLEAEALAEQLSSKKINIYAGTGENAELSNFAVRPFVSSIVFDDATYQTVEGAFQAAKLNYVKEGSDNQGILGKLQTANGAQAKALGRQIKGLDTKAWDANSSRIMKDLLKASFEQNPSALKTLLETGNAELTHTQDRGKWGKEFPALLMEVREELAPQVSGMAIVSSGKVKLKDGKYHNIADINAAYLSEKGFAKKDINNILKEICKLG